MKIKDYKNMTDKEFAQWEKEQTSKDHEEDKEKLKGAMKHVDQVSKSMDPPTGANYPAWQKRKANAKSMRESAYLSEDEKQKLKSLAQVHPEVADAVAKVIRTYMNNPKKDVKILIQQVSKETGVNPGMLKSCLEELGLTDND
jgi:hypothetical protein